MNSPLLPSLKEILGSSKKTLSFEVFPPKTPEGEKILYQNLSLLKQFQPDFISVTMGAMGSNRDKTFEIVDKIQNELGLLGVAHLTCVASTKDDILKSLETLQGLNIRHLLCLRGDPPQGQAQFSPPKNGFHYASELVHFVREQTQDSFCIGVAAYPEGHTEAKSKQEDLQHLKIKIEAGVDFVITQLFFDNKDYFNFLGELRALGIRVPVLPGIMPVTNYKQLQKFTAICGAKIPQSMQQKLNNIQEDTEAVKNFGTRYAAEQATQLLQQGASGLHFYLLNQSDSFVKIYGELKRFIFPQS